MSITTALKARREQMSDREAGFTLIELLVVVIIIGILAAIAIPVYIGVQNNAKDSAAQSDLTNIKTAQVAYFTKNGSYASTSAALADFGYTASSSSASYTPVIKPVAGPPATFCASIKSDSGTFFQVTQATSPTSSAAACA